MMVMRCRKRYIRTRFCKKSAEQKLTKVDSADPNLYLVSSENIFTFIP